MKKLISVLAALFVAVMLPCAANAAIASGTGWELSDDGVLTITQNSGSNYTSSTQPWANYRDSIVEAKITVSNGLGSSLLEDCTNLKKVTFVGNLGKVRNNAFKNCTSLTSIDLTTATEIRTSAFEGSGLEKVVLPEGISWGGYTNQFDGCNDLLFVTLPEGLTEIPKFAFCHTAIESITIPEGVTKIGEYAFYDCPYLEEISFPSTLTEIGYAAFRASGLPEELVLPEGLTTLADQVFDATTSGTYGYQFPETAYEDFNSYTHIVKTNGSVRVVIPDSVTTMGTSTFSTRTNLRSAKLSKNATTVPANAFYQCTGLESVIIPEGVTTIGGDAFYHCDSLERISVPSTLTTIGANTNGKVRAFKYDTNLKEVYCKEKDTWTSVFATDIDHPDVEPTVIVGKELVAADFAAQETKELTSYEGDDGVAAGVGVTLTNVDDAASSFSKLTWTLTSGEKSNTYEHKFDNATIELSAGAFVKAAIVVKGVTEFTYDITLQ